MAEESDGDEPPPEEGAADEPKVTPYMPPKSALAATAARLRALSADFEGESLLPARSIRLSFDMDNDNEDQQPTRTTQVDYRRSMQQDMSAYSSTGSDAAREGLHKCSIGTFNSEATSMSGASGYEQVQVTYESREVHGPRWRRLCTLNCGCAEAYIPPPGDRGMRLKVQDRPRAASAGDLLEGGLIVQYFNQDRRFEHRILKTDRRRSFLYLLKVTLQHAEMDPIILRIGDIAQVFGGEEAMFLVESNSVADSKLDSRLLSPSTVVVVSCCKTGEPSFKDLTFFVAPPQADLRHTLLQVKAEVESLAKAAPAPAFPSVTKRMVVSAAAAAAAVFAVTGKPITHQVKNRVSSIKNDASQTREFWWRLDGVRVKALGPVLRAARSEDFGVVLELRLRPLDERGRAAVHFQTVEYPLSPELALCRAEAISSTCRKEITKILELLGGMPAVDGMRLNMAVLEVALFHRWAQVVAPYFGGDFHGWMRDWKTLQNPREPMPYERESIAEGVPQQPVKSDILDGYCRTTLKASLVAVRQLLDFEDAFLEVTRPQPRQR